MSGPRLRHDLDAIPSYKAGQPARVIPGVSPHKLSSNEIPFPPLPSVLAAAEGALGDMHRYPDFSSSALVRALAERFGAPVSDIAVATGSVGLAQQLVQIAAGPGNSVMFGWRSFESYPIVTQIAGATRQAIALDGADRYDLDAMHAAIDDTTRVIFVCNPNNPTGAVYPRETLAALAEIAERRHLVFCADEIYDEMLYGDAAFVPAATLAKNTLCLTFGGLSKIYRACGLRVGWLVFSGEREHARDYIQAVELLASLRLCSNVPGQYAVQTALGGHQSIFDLTRPGGRLHATRAAVLEAVGQSPYLSVVPPRGAMYAFVRVHSDRLPGGVKKFDDQAFALDLLERKHVLVAPGSSFNVPYRDHFRVTLLPDAEQMADVFARIESLLDEYAAA